MALGKKIKIKGKYAGIFIGSSRINKPDPITSIFLKTTITETCWNWNGTISKDGYGLIVHKKKRSPVHRFLYETFYGPISDNMVCCHVCDNRRCINPVHIFIGTRADNQHDMKIKKRSASGERNGKSKLTTQDVKKIRAMYKDGAFQRDIADAMSVSQTSVSNIINVKSWKGEL